MQPCQTFPNCKLFRLYLGINRRGVRRLHLTSLLCWLAVFARAEDSPPEQFPLNVDLRPALGQYHFTPSEQGARGTCSVFTMRGALEFAIAKRLGECPRLSVEFLNWSANQSSGHHKDGGFFSDMWRGFSTYGICLDSAMPYQAQFDATLTPTPAALADAKSRLELGLRLHWIKEWNVRTGLTAAHLAAIKQTLSQGWPVAGGFRWPKHPRWKDNTLQMCSPEAVFDGHSVLLVGYRDETEPPGAGVFIFQNSAGPAGIGRMPYTYARDYMNDAVWMDSESIPKRVPNANPQTP